MPLVGIPTPGQTLFKSPELPPGTDFTADVALALLANRAAFTLAGYGAEEIAGISPPGEAFADVLPHLRAGTYNLKTDRDIGPIYEQLGIAGMSNHLEHVATLEQAYQRALEILRGHWQAVEIIAQALLERELLTALELRPILSPLQNGP